MELTNIWQDRNISKALKVHGMDDLLLCWQELYNKEIW